MRTIVGALAVIFAAGCARGIVHGMDAVEATELTSPDADPSPDASAPAIVLEDDSGGGDRRDADATPAEPTSCEATKTDDACFECCEAKYPNAIDIWIDALDACCPNDECTDAEYEKCETVADGVCAKDPECSGLDLCEETSSCYEK